MSKLILEEILPDAQRQVKGIASDEGMQNVAVPSQQTPGMGNDVAKPVLPFQVNASISQIFDLFEKITTLRKSFEDAQKNPSIKESQKISLKRAVIKLDKINRLLLHIPKFLDSFVIAKR